MKEEETKNEYPLIDLLGKSSLEAIGKIIGRGYRRTRKDKKKIIVTNGSMTTFQLKLLMEEMPKGALHGR